MENRGLTGIEKSFESRPWVSKVAFVVVFCNVSKVCVFVITFWFGNKLAQNRTCHDLDRQFISRWFVWERWRERRGGGEEKEER